MMILCTILCANILAAQTQFTSGGLKYEVIDNNSVKVASQNSSDISGSVIIPSTVTYNGTTYSVTSIGEWVFNSCSRLTSVTIPNSVTSIGNSAFWDCSRLTSVTIPNSVTSIGSSTFLSCSGLTSINVASGNTHYSSIDGVLYNYVQDTLIQCPGAKTLVTIPNSVTSIGDGAFWDCSGLTSVTIPNSVTSIGNSAFYGCSGLTTLNFNAINCQDFEAYYNGHYYSTFGTSLTTVNIGDSVQRIPAYFVKGCSGLTSVTLPNSLTSIGDWAFNACSGLTSVTLPNSLTSIGDWAFRGCSGLTSITLPNSLTSIGESTFRGCSGLTSITIPNNVTSIGGLAFGYCSGLTTLNFNAISCQDFELKWGWYNERNEEGSGRIGLYSLFHGTSLTMVNIGDSVRRIPANFVRDHSNLTSVTIPNNVTSIGDTAFSGCSGLTSVTIPNSVTSIGNSAFNGCSGLTSVTIPNSVTSIGNSAFNGCSGLTSVTIPNSVTSIGGGAFSGCSGLTSVTIGNSVTSIGNEAFYGCRGLTSVTIGNSVTSIGGSAFSGCSGLTSVTIPNSVTSIGYYAFYGCRGLTSVTIGNSLTSIGYSAFYECLNLSSLISLATVPPTIGNEAFPYPNICTVTVPCGSLAAYTASTCYWSVYFPQRITESSSFELSVSANEEAYGSVEVETQSCNVKTLTAIANEGYEFTAWNDGNAENPRTVTVTSDTAFMAIFAEAVSTPTITLTVNDETMGSATYTLDGNTAVLTATANEGYSFVIWSDGNTENPRTVTITSDTAFMAIFSPASSLQEVNASEFALYPNPAKSFATLEFEALQENTLLQILDINGRRVRTLELKAGVETLRIDLGDLPKGVYTVMLGNTTKKLIVE